MKLGISLAAVAALASCNFNPDTRAAVDPNAPDADPNAPDADPSQPDANPLCMQWEPANFDACALMGPMGGLDLSIDGKYTYDTDIGELRDPMGNLVPHTSEMLSMTPAVRAMVVDNVTLAPASSLVVSGMHPLLIASFDEIDLEGVVDLGAELGDPHIPAGHQPTACEGAAAPGPGSDAAGGSGGGGGGGFAGAGGDGGDGDGDGTTEPGGPGGLAVSATPGTPRGGCAGARGGWVGSGEFAGGGGGGALQLSARTRIQVRGSGAIDGRGAGGTGAVPPPNDGGGGGGGSGGWIGLDAPTIELAQTAVVAANGGGGGGGASGGTGSNGSDGELSASPASGGPGASNASSGEDGGAGASVAGITVTDQQGGGAGGGGGSAGFVVVWGNLTRNDSAIISPDPTTIAP